MQLSLLKKIVEFGLVLLVALTSIAADNEKASVGSLKFENYAELKNFVIKAISKGKAKVWLYSSKITDGEVASALYVAKYRKAEVKVMIDATAAYSYMSRLKFFKRNHMDVSLKPSNFKPISQTVLIVDESVYFLNGALDFLQSDRRFRVVESTSDKIQKVVNEMEAAFANKSNNANADAPRTFSQSNRTPLIQPSYHSQPSRGWRRSGSNDTFFYSMKNDQKPDYISSRLPKETISSKNSDTPQTPPKRRIRNPWLELNRPYSDDQNYLEY